jgi:hypothetical protein
MRALIALIAALSVAAPAAARIYAQDELADFNIAGVKLGMGLDEAARALREHGYAGAIDPAARVSNFNHEGGAVVSVERAGGNVSAVGMFQTLPSGTTQAQLDNEIVPTMIKRFGDPTRRENAGSVTVLVYGSSEHPSAGAISMTLRISSAGIDGRLGR